MYIFSVKQRSHDRFPFLYDGARATIDHLIFGSGFNFFSQMWDDIVVLCLLPSFLKDYVWPYHRLLKLTVLPTYSFCSPSGPFNTFAWYMTSVCPLQSLSRGHLCLFLLWQLHFFPSLGGSCSSAFMTFALWEEMMLLMFLVQLYEILTVFLLSSLPRGGFCGSACRLVSGTAYQCRLSLQR